MGDSPISEQEAFKEVCRIRGVKKSKKSSGKIVLGKKSQERLRKELRGHDIEKARAMTRAACKVYRG